jgi:hypothetical protein
VALPAILKESVLTFAEATEACQLIAGRKPSVKSIYAWADLGVMVGGERVKLETARLGGRRVTSREALERFIEATAGEEESKPPAVIRAPAARRRASEQALARLEKRWAKI